jgi:putative toxin-antitoxin system antitoxin component (TIGR02293 family)
MKEWKNPMAPVKKEKKSITGKYVAPSVFLQGTPFSATEQTYDEYMQQAEKFIGKTFPGFTLGLKITRDKPLADLTKEGLPFNYFVHLCRLMELSYAKLAEITSITDRTLARRKKEGRLAVTESDRLVRISILFENAIRVLGSSEKANQWLKTPKKALGGKIPLEYADTEIGTREVEDLLGRLEHGVFS